MTLDSRIYKLENRHIRGLTYACPVPPGASQEEVERLHREFLAAHPDAHYGAVVLAEDIKKAQPAG